MDTKIIKNIKIQMPIIEIISSVKNQFEYKNVKKNVFINAPTYIIGTQKKEENNG